ncbi:hypothetical protein V8C35DRAFT_327886 [Trichoderma chlorosporum]
MASSSTPATPLPRHEILHSLRSQMESSHRILVRQRSADMRWLHQPNITDLDALAAEKTLEEADDCCNKAVPIYSSLTLLHTLNNYLFEKWHRPYRNEIEYVQFLAKTFLPWILPSDLQPRPLIDLAASVHRTICDRAKAARDAVGKLDPGNPQEGPDLPKRWDWYDILDTIRSQQYFILRPLFRAIIISIRAETYLGLKADMSQLLVLLIRTGVEDGLSAPISFEPIAHKIHSIVYGSNGQVAVQLALEAAVDFVMSLESREVAAFGHQPDPVASTQELEDGGLVGSRKILREARQLGWGDEPLAGPSSRWVQDPEKMPQRE